MVTRFDENIDDEMVAVDDGTYILHSDFEQLVEVCKLVLEFDKNPPLEPGLPDDLKQKIDSVLKLLDIT